MTVYWMQGRRILKVTTENYHDLHSLVAAMPTNAHRKAVLQAAREGQPLYWHEDGRISVKCSVAAAQLPKQKAMALNAKLSPEAVADIRSSTMTVAELAAHYRVSPRTVYRVLAGETWIS